MAALGAGTVARTSTKRRRCIVNLAKDLAAKGGDHADQKKPRPTTNWCTDGRSPQNSCSTWIFSAPDKTARTARHRPAENRAEDRVRRGPRAYRDGYGRPRSARQRRKADPAATAPGRLRKSDWPFKAIASRFSGIETRMETEAVDVAVAVARKPVQRVDLPSRPFG